jgi:hypothetical protein
VALPVLRVPLRLRRRRLLPDVRRPHPGYFGENYNATNYGPVYSGKLVSDLFGGGLGSMVVDAWGCNGA